MAVEEVEEIGVECALLRTAREEAAQDEEHEGDGNEEQPYRAFARLPPTVDLEDPLAQHVPKQGGSKGAVYAERGPPAKTLDPRLGRALDGYDLLVENPLNLVLGCFVLNIVQGFVEAAIVGWDTIQTEQDRSLDNSSVTKQTMNYMRPNKSEN